MTRSDVLRHAGRAALAVAALVGGCASSPHAQATAGRPTTAPVAVAAVPTATVGWEHVRVRAIDGNGGPFDAHAFGGVLLAPGRHTLLVHLQANFAPFVETMSDDDVEVAFTVEAGHQYRLDGWPTTVRDVTDRHADGRAYAVDQTTRYTAWEE